MSSTIINNPEPSANALSHQKVSRLTSTALFAALICVTTAYIFHIPFGVNGGYVHIGDSLIYLAAAFLPTPYAMFAGAIGGAMADPDCPGICTCNLHHQDADLPSDHM